MKLTHTISLIEILWTLLTAIGLYYNARILSKAVGDFHAVKIAGNNSLREYSARLTVWTYSSWTVVQFMFVAVGLISMTLPAAGHKGQPATISYVLSVIFIFCSFVLALSSYVVEAGRERLIEMIERDLHEVG